MTAEALEQYKAALKAGKKYYKDCVARGIYPYPAALDDILANTKTSAQMDLGVINIPSELIAGTKTAGRVAALAGNFMPLLDTGSEFASKWTNLCDAHLSDEGIRDPVKCYEYLGRFYIEEGNKRVSVLLSYGAPTVPAHVIRILPEYSDDHDILVYYEFIRFYAASGIYSVQMRHRGQYAKLLAALGMDESQHWTVDQQRSFTAGFSRFKETFAELDKGNSGATAGEALLVWLSVFKFSDIKTDTNKEFTEKLRKLLPDIKIAAAREGADIFTEVDSRLESEKSRDVITKSGIFGKKTVKIAFIYAFDPQISAWTRAHDYGRKYLEQCFEGKTDISVYEAYGKDYYEKIEQAISDGATIIFATTPSMMEACRKAAVLYKDVTIFNCSPAMPYAGVLTYYSRIYEAKFIAGAVAGIMAESDTVGYIADYPIMGVFANINAFALGVRMTNPKAKVKLHWSCLPGNPINELILDDVHVISNRDATNSKNEHWPLEWGTYKLGEEDYITLATPCWSWDKMYEKMVLGVLHGSWSHSTTDKPVNLWWGMSSGVTDIQISPALPDGVKTLARLLKDGIGSGAVNPFLTRIVDKDGIVRCDGETPLTPDEIVKMDWLCDNVDGIKPEFEDILPQSRELVQLLGVYREKPVQEAEEEQL